MAKFFLLNWNVVWLLGYVSINGYCINIINLLKGESKNLSCTAEDVIIDSFEWTFNNLTSTFDHNDSICDNDEYYEMPCNSSFSILNIWNVQQSNEGDYYCVGNLVDNTTITIAAYRVIVHQLSAPVITTNISSPIEVKPRSNISLEVFIANVQWNLTQWRFNNNPISDFKDQFNITNQYESGMLSTTLHLYNLIQNNSGNYSVHASNSYASVATNFSITIAAAAAIIHPNSSSTLMSIRLNYPFKVKCTARGVPQPVITWDPAFPSFESNMSSYNSTDGYYYTTSQLGFMNALKNSTLVYTCSASNGQSDHAIYNLTITYGANIISRSNNLTIFFHRSVKFTCVAEGSPIPTIIWRDSDGVIENNSIYENLNNNRINSTLIVDTSEIKNSSYLFSCLASNPIGNSATTFSITIQTLGDIIKLPMSTEVTAPNGTSITCIASSYQTSHITWRFSNNTEIRFSSMYNITVLNRFNSIENILQIFNVSLSDNGTLYRCEATLNLPNQTSISIAAHSILIVYVVPNITSYLPEGAYRYVVNVTEDITFQCTATGVPPPDIQWYRGSDPLKSSIDTRITIYDALTNNSNGTVATVTRNITLTRTNVNDAGNYRCEATNVAAGGMDSEEFELFVGVPAIITEVPVSQTVTLPASANFSCTASGAPLPNITWIGPNHNVILSEESGVNITYQIIEPNTTRSVLSLSEVNLSNNGTYVCRAGNNITKVNFTSESADLIVYVVPNITSYLPEGSSRYVVNVTDDITFQCTATGVPPPNIQWYRGNVTLNSTNDRIDIRNIVELRSLALTSSNLTIISSIVADGGNYSCQATNSAQGGADDETFILLVQSPPTIFSLNQTVQFNETAKICFQIEPFDINYEIMWYYTSNTSLETSIENFNYFQVINLSNSTTSCSTVIITNHDSCHYCLTITKNISISESLQETNQGIYAIEATNAAGLSTTNYSNVFINDFPYILVTPTMITVALETTMKVSFTCFAILHVNLSWEHTKLDGQTYAIEEGSKYHIQTYPNKQTLIIREVSIADTGNYTCKATNNVGKRMTSGFLIANDSYFTTTVPARITMKTDMSIVLGKNISATSLIVIVPSVAGSVCVLACVFLTFIAGMCFVKRKKNKSKESMNGVDGIEVELIRKDSEVPLCYFPPEQGSECREPIPLELLSTHLDTMHWNENCGFVEEFKIIQEKSPSKPATACLLPKNSYKNRYINIKCFDETRVELTPDEGFSNDYINANFIKGYNRPKEYIACQGPLDDTIADFWKMVYDYDAPTIVMLTNLVEKMKLKCAQYWPQYDYETYSKYEVTVVNTTTLADFVIRDIKITNKDDGNVKEVKQLHFISWPDFGVPRNPTPLLHFLQRVRTFHPYSDNRPMIFHCSAGVGRTGTLITIDVELQRANKENIVDPFNFVRKLREQRNFMVQAEAQYIFLHDAILEGSVSGNTEVPVEELSKKMEYLNESSEEMDNGYKKEFELLKQFKIDVRELSVANEDKNAFKNRVTNALPYNYNRVILQMKPGCSGSDYINASFVDGYSKKAAYIATQGPLPNTVEDFWRMVWEMSVNVIVMLTQLVEKDKEMCCCYWPEKIGSTKKIGDFIVELLSEDKYDDYCTREIKIFEQESGKTCMLRQFHFTSWPEHGAPESGVGMVDLIDQVTRRQRQTGDNHIVVHCSAGVGRTGAFICLSIAIERVQSEGVVDIFHTIKHLRTQRPHLIQNVDQYIFCYNAIRDYVESLDNYSNLK